ncbi:hypothetical protein [Ideonella sp.]|uniref:hypothetical protein n=1 Tax=Ideonella sp. TaxID=1929293 RepID=UPI0037BE92D7
MMKYSTTNIRTSGKKDISPPAPEGVAAGAAAWAYALEMNTTFPLESDLAHEFGEPLPMVDSRCGQQAWLQAPGKPADLCDRPRGQRWTSKQIGTERAKQKALATQGSEGFRSAKIIDDFCC